MYRRHNKDQFSMFDSNRRYVVYLNEENRWVKLSKLMPWDKIEDHYAQNMCEDNGREAITSRIAFGAIYAKEALNLTDTGITEQISENPYIQFFLGLPAFCQAPLFDPSMMVHFRKRFTTDFIKRVNDYICTGKWPEDDDPDQNLPPIEDQKKSEKKGKLILDATCAPSDIRHPSDVMILDECREHLESFIDVLWENSKKEGHKTPYNRHNAHKKTINFIKKKQKTKTAVRSALNAQLRYVALAIRQVFALLLYCGVDSFKEREWEQFDLICRVYLQQKQMLDDNTNRCEGKIMSLKMPFVRAILRNKAKAKYEYGQKLALSKANGFVFVEHQSWENFNECNTLQQSVMDYHRRFGYFPEAVLADQIYHTRLNMKFCKERGIRLSGNGRTRKSADQSEKEQVYADQCERNAIEGVNGVLKRRYGLDLILCWNQHNAEVEAYLQILALNLQRRLRLLCALLHEWLVSMCDGWGIVVFQ